jgi:predicted nucleic acid-binding protein
VVRVERNTIYLDTSVLNFFFEDMDLEKANSTRELFREIRNGKFNAYISELVLREIGRTRGLKRERLLSLIKTYKIPWLEVTPECMELTEKYMERKIFPTKYRDDGFHIAIATVHQIDVVVSWNLRHMVKLRTRHEVKAINIAMGYKEIEICTPMEVIESD